MSDVANTGIEAVVFDLSEVYINGLKGTHERVGSHLGSVVESTSLGGEQLTRLFHGEITEAEYWSDVISRNGWDLEAEDLERMVRENFTVIDGTEGVVRDLKDKKYKLGLLSVHAREWVEYCEDKFHYRELFDAVGYSFEHGLSKPDPRAYELILEALGAIPEHSLFIDDKEENVNAARDIGMTAIQFSTAYNLRQELVGKGLL